MEYDYQYLEEYDELHLADSFNDYEVNAGADDIYAHIDSSYPCIHSTLVQISLYAVGVIAWPILARLLRTALRPYLLHTEWPLHAISALCGFASLYSTVGFDFLIVLLLNLLLYALWSILAYECRRWNRNLALPLTIITIGAHFIYEAAWRKPESWQRIRGIQMISTMKLISLLYDHEKLLKQRKGLKDKCEMVPPLVAFLGYTFCPATCVVGPWTSYASYLRNLHTPLSTLRRWWWIVQTMLNLALALLFVSISNCVAPQLCTNPAVNQWRCTFLGAASVRFSHYFICYLSQASTVAGGVEDNDQPQSKWLGNLVTQPLKVEFPRSLASLVRSWNIPMHYWLKSYIFRPLRSEYPKRYSVALGCTYLVSCLLHGFHIQIYLVLLSLGLFAYVESVLRQKLAAIFDACVGANDCPAVRHERTIGRKPPCGFRYCPSHLKFNLATLYVHLANAGFTVLALFHLAYLGVMMNTDDLYTGERNLSWQRAVAKWMSLNFASHWLVLITFAFYYII